MPEFFNVVAPVEALATLIKVLPSRVRPERVETRQAFDRITAEAIYSQEDLPSFPRSAMDGYSIRSSDTFGASEGMPAYLEVAGQVPMGATPRIRIGPGQAAKAFTGGMLAEGADAVVIIENTQTIDDRTIEVLRPVASGENVIQVGEDVHQHDLLLPAGHILRAQDIGGLLALGINHLTVAARPVISIVSTGDELVPPETRPRPGQIRDINSYSISALTEKAGGISLRIGLGSDDYETQRRLAQRGLAEGDMLVFSAGSSVSARDLTARVFSDLGKPGVLVHGISIKPGKPTLVALLDGKPAFGLPGNPVSAMVVFNLLVRPTIYALSGCLHPPDQPSVVAKLQRDIPSVAGREDHVQVRLAMQDGVLWAQPVFGKSNLIYTLIRADGEVTVPLDKSGLYSGEDVMVRLY